MKKLEILIIIIIISSLMFLTTGCLDEITSVKSTVSQSSLKKNYTVIFLLKWFDKSYKCQERVVIH